MAWTTAQKKYTHSTKGVAARKRYQESEKGKLARARYLTSKKAKKLEQAQPGNSDKPRGDQKVQKPVQEETKSKK